MAPIGSSSSASPDGVGDVLVVDDSPAVRRKVANALADLGVPEDRMTVLASGDEALETFTPLSPGLVLLDTSMPGIDTYDVVQAMLLEAPESRVVPLTEKPADHPEIGELRSFGVFDILRKPIRVADLEELLRQIDDEQTGIDRIR